MLQWSQRPSYIKPFVRALSDSRCGLAGPVHCDMPFTPVTGDFILKLEDGEYGEISVRERGWNFAVPWLLFAPALIILGIAAPLLDVLFRNQSFHVHLGEIMLVIAGILGALRIAHLATKSRRVVLRDGVREVAQSSSKGARQGTGARVRLRLHRIEVPVRSPKHLIDTMYKTYAIVAQRGDNFIAIASVKDEVAIRKYAATVLRPALGAQIEQGGVITVQVNMLKGLFPEFA